MGTPAHQTARPALKVLHWLPVLERVQFKAMCISHRLMHGKGPGIIASPVQPYRANRSLRSNDLHLASVPRIKRSRSGGRLFSYNASKLWNSLPLQLRKKPKYMTFRKSLKTWLFPK